MASAQIFTDGNFQGVGTDGLVVPNGKLYIYDNATGLLATTYQDSAQTITNVNPVILSASGKAKVFLSAGTYDITLKTSADVIVWTLDNFTYDELYTKSESDAILSARTVGTIAALRTTIYSGQPFVSVTGYYTAADNIGVREYYWDAVSVEADNSGTIIQVTGVATGRWKMKYSGAVNVKWFGAKGDGVSDDITALNSAIAFELANKKGLEFPTGTYLVSSTLNFLGSSVKDVSFIAVGKVTIYNTGSGNVATLDAETVAGTPVGMRADRVKLLGDWIFRGNATSTNGLFIRGLVESTIEARAYDIATSGFVVDWGVLSSYKLTCSKNIDTFTVHPQYGIQITQSVAGNYPADSNFDLRMEEASIAGIDYIYGGLGNRFTGTSESVPTGFIQRSTASDAIIFGMDFEANTVRDILIEGRGLKIIGISSSSTGTSPNISITATAQQVGFELCNFLRRVDVDIAAKGVTFSQCAFSDNASLGITGTGRYNVKVFGCTKVNTSSAWTSDFKDVIGNSGTWTPTITAGGGAMGAITTNECYYRLEGNLCYINGYITIDKGTLIDGNVTISGLPFAGKNLTNYYQYMNVQDIGVANMGAGYTYPFFRIAPGGSGLLLLRGGNNVAAITLPLSLLPATMIFKFSGSYEADTTF